MLIPTHACPKCGEWWFVVYANHGLWRVHPVLPKHVSVPLQILICPVDGVGLVPFLIDFEAPLPKEPA
jgi:hypothetical protein